MFGHTVSFSATLLMAASKDSDSDCDTDRNSMTHSTHVHTVSQATPLFARRVWFVCSAAPRFRSGKFARIYNNGEHEAT